MFWHNLEQARQRLSGSIVMYGNKPVRFSDIDDEDTRVRDIETGKVITVSLSDEAFNDFRNVPGTGYVNVPGYVAFLRRIPVRSQTHGLCRSNVRVTVPVEGTFRTDQMNLDTVVTNYGTFFAEACRDEYPTFSQAVDLSSETQPIAFSKKYAVVFVKGIRTLCRDEDSIGVVTTDGTCLLNKKALCFREELLTLGVTSILEL